MNDEETRLIRDVATRVGDQAERVGFESRKFREFLDFDFHARSMHGGFLEDMAEGRR